MPATTHLDNVHVIVLEVNEQLQPRRPFIVAVEQAKQEPANPRFVRELTTLDLSVLLGPRDFYVLDDHMNPRGHQVVGEALAKLIGALPAGILLVRFPLHSSRVRGLRGDPLCSW